MSASSASTPSKTTNTPAAALTPPRNTAGRGSGPVDAHKGSGIPHGHVPAYLPGSASLVEELDQRVLIVLRDGKHIVGTLTSYDQYSNLILNDAVERRLLTLPKEGSDDNNNSNTTTYYADVPLGLYVIRGDSMVLCGSVNDTIAPNNGILESVTLDQLHQLQEGTATPLPPLEWDFDTDLVA